MVPHAPDPTWTGNGLIARMMCSSNCIVRTSNSNSPRNCLAGPTNNPNAPYGRHSPGALMTPSRNPLAEQQHHGPPQWAAHRAGRSMIAKNKEDTVILASSSPTIVQKESSDGGSSAGSTTAPVLVAGAGLNLAQVGPSPAAVAAPAAGAAATHETDTAELALAEQSLYETVRNPLAPGAAGPTSVLALAAAAAVDSAGSGPGLQLPSVATQLADGLLASAAGLPAGHAPLSSSSTIKQAAGAQGPTAGVAGSSPRRSASSASGELRGPTMGPTRLTPEP